MGQKTNSFCPGLSTEQSHSWSLNPLNMFARLQLKLTSHPETS